MSANPHLFHISQGRDFLFYRQRRAELFLTCAFWAMPGYTHEVVMAAGAFVQGSSIELSADAPMVDPYICYFQGGLTYEHGRIGCLYAADAVLKQR